MNCCRSCEMPLGSHPGGQERLPPRFVSRVAGRVPVGIINSHESQTAFDLFVESLPP